jgi:hypothetical protein
MPRLLLAAVLALAAHTAGCSVSYSSLKTARALPPGSWRLDLAPGGRATAPLAGTGARDHRPEERPAVERSPALPAFELQVRRGMVRGVDLGLKTNGLGLELNATIEIARGERWCLALAPAVQETVSTNLDDEGWQLTALKLPVLVGWRFGSAHQHEVVVGPAVMGTIGSPLMGNGHVHPNALLGGGTVGTSIALTPSLRVFVELAGYTPLVAEGVPAELGTIRMAPDVGPGRPVVLQLGAGLSIGADGAAPR